MKLLHPFKRNVLPNERQALLLKACLITDPGMAQSAFKEWQDSVDLDFVDQGSFRLTPYLWKRAREESWDLGEDEGRIRGLYRYHWSKYQILQRSAKMLLERFAESNIPATILKGAALSRLVYADPVCRPFSDIDLLVPSDRMCDAIDVLGGDGWNTLQVDIDAAIDELHAIGFMSSRKIEIDLHQHVIESNATSEVTAKICSRLQTINWGGAEATTLGFEDHLIHTCTHGAVFSPWPQIRWLVDSCRILRHCGSSFDWELLIGSASDFRCVLPVVETLDWLVDELDQDVPKEALEELHRLPTGNLDRFHFFVSSLKTPEASKFRHRLPIDCLNFTRRSPFDFSSEWFVALKAYIVAVNNFDRPSLNLFRSWYYIVLLRIRNIQYGYLPFFLSRSENHKIHRDSISRWKESEIFGFHLLECDPERRLLRWSSPSAGLLLRDVCEDLTLELDTLNCRPGIFESSGITFVLNGVLLPESACRFSESGVFIIEVKRPYRPEKGDVWLSWKLDPWEMTPLDPRELGLPVFAIRIAGIRRKEKTLSGNKSHSEILSPGHE